MPRRTGPQRTGPQRTGPQGPAAARSALLDTRIIYCGDCLDQLAKLPDGCVDLIYIDPPFNSNRNYEVFWGETKEKRAFEDRHASTQAYIDYMRPRCVELARVLKKTGSFYYHCDWHASHYVKVMLDQILGENNFLNEIIWKRQSAHSDAKQGSKHLGRVHDSILLYTGGGKHTFNHQYRPYDPEYVSNFYRHVEPDTGRRYRLGDITAPGGAAPSKGNPHYEFLGVTRYWRYSKENMKKLYAEGRIIQTKPGRVPQYKRYLDEGKGTPIGTIWDDINPVHGSGGEALGYPTQKPLALLNRILELSSTPNDIVLDAFCGCGTAVAAAEKLKRQWIGIDITHLAVALMKNRLKTAFDLDPAEDYDVVGEPQDVGSARALWEQDPYQFQFWAVSLLEAQPQGEQKRGADRGIDGLLYFIDGTRRTSHKMVVQVKGGRVSSPQIRDLKGVVERENAALGLFITLDEPTRDMRTEAASGGFFHSELWDRDFPKIQIRTIRQMLEGRGFELPPRPSAYQPAQRVRRTQGTQVQMDGLGAA